MSSDPLIFEQAGIGNILRTYRLRVPPNQREYAWTEREVGTLFQDFSRAISEGAESYYLGSIVTVPRQPSVLEVVDGQQRLATTAILLDAIREYLADRDEIIAAAIQELLTDIDTDARELVPKLTLNVADNEYFQAAILGSSNEAPHFQSHELLLAAKRVAAKHVRRIVAEHSESMHGDILNSWLKFIRHRAIVILMKVSNAADAYKMFETLNDRGLKTSQADLIKNYLFGQADERLGEAQSKWSLMRGALETADEDDITLTFLRQAMISLRGYIRQENLFDTVEREFRGAGPSLRFLDTLESASNDYVAILTPSHEKWNSYPTATRHAIETLSLLDIKPMRPLLLAIARRFAPTEAATAFRAAISWSVRLLVAGGSRSGAVEQPLAARARDVTGREIQTAADLAEKIQAVIPTDDQFRDAFAIANVSKASLARYYLRALETVCQNGSNPWFIVNDNRDVINLEHVLPKRPAENWPEFTQDEVRTYARRLGNQALLRAASNSDLKSAPFAEKSTVYGESPYVLTQQIASAGSWNVDAVTQRQKKMSEIALDAWPLL